MGVGVEKGNQTKPQAGQETREGGKGRLDANELRTCEAKSGEGTNRSHGVKIHG